MVRGIKRLDIARELEGIILLSEIIFLLSNGKVEHLKTYNLAANRSKGALGRVLKRIIQTGKVKEFTESYLSTLGEERILPY